MKIYTYYDNLNYLLDQDELIDLWKLSWSRQGYEPVVLGLEDAKKHSYYETLNREMQKIYQEVTGKSIEGYGMSCWFRWLAYATQTEEKFYVSDYDAINDNFPITEPINKLHLMDGDCPFLASGTPKQFENLCKAFVEISRQEIEFIKSNNTNMKWYHDQEFFMYTIMPMYNPNHEKLQNQMNIEWSRDRDSFGGYYDPVVKKPFTDYIGHSESKPYKVYHISYENCEQMHDKYPDFRKNYTDNDDRTMRLNDLRLYMVKEILGIK